MRKLYRATVVMGAATFVAMITGVVKSKFLALQLGPVGVGVFSQAMTFFQTAETICGLGMSFGITKYVSEMWNKRNWEDVKNTMFASIFLQVISFTIFFVLASIFSRQISQFVFSSAGFSPFLLLMSLAVLFSTLIMSLESMLLGMGKPGTLSKARIVYYMMSVALLVLFVGMMKINGGFIYIVVNALASLLIIYGFLVYSLKSEEKVPISNTFRGFKKVDIKSYSTKLLSYGVVMIVSSVFTWITILYIRSTLIKEVGASANGLYQVVFALISYYTPFFTNGLWGYLFPKLSAIKDTEFFNIEVNMALRLILLFVTPAIVALFLLKKPLVILIFSKEFLGSLEIFPLYLLGSFFFMISYLFGTTFLANKQLRAYFLISLIQNILYAFLFAQSVGKLGFLAIAVSYFAMNLFACAVSVCYQMYKIKLKVNAQNVKLFFLSIGFISVIFFTPCKSALCYLAKWMLLAAWILLITGKREKALLLSFIRYRQL